MDNVPDRRQSDPVDALQGAQQATPNLAEQFAASSPRAAPCASLRGISQHRER
ncbi:hypothetical protein K0M31_002960 [Melipona bicolor]|uniref:Uncharacterized protein n=1 Tax=Melipona bicolor TaxID=60889 RepID=A0AA40KQ38_9HYME|nr:hypothetical protein K0M31_002960 [Melipona bicolor]